MVGSRFVVVGIALIIGCWMMVADARAQEPGWTSGVVKRGTDRVISNSTDILSRPYRPLHFYGNTKRRRHYQGRALPSRHDLQMTARMLGQPSSCRGGSQAKPAQQPMPEYVEMPESAPQHINVAEANPASFVPNQAAQQRSMRTRRQTRRSTGQMRRR